MEVSMASRTAPSRSKRRKSKQQLRNIRDFRLYVDHVLENMRRDPPNSQYQDGFRACFLQLREERFRGSEAIDRVGCYLDGALKAIAMQSSDERFWLGYEDAYQDIGR